MDELAALSFQRLIREGKLASSGAGKLPVYLPLQDETGFPHQGTIDFCPTVKKEQPGSIEQRTEA